MGLEQRLQQRVRASKFADEEIDNELSEQDQDEHPDSGESSADEGSESGSDKIQVDTILRGDQRDEAESDDEVSDQQDSAFADISFGALASAQASLGSSLKRKRPTPDQSSSKKHKSRSPSPFHEAEERRAGHKSASHSQRASKHAPTEISSKRAVSRKRAVVNMPVKPQARDPRFSSLSGNLNEDKVKGNYAFLNDYRASEMADLKTRIKQEKDASRKEGLKRQLRAMEDRERARAKVEEERRVIREHRKQEKEAVQQGKKPFFLKQSDIKKQVLQQKFEAMSEKKAERMMERRRKKKASKERKNMPDARRMGT